MCAVFAISHLLSSGYVKMVMLCSKSISSLGASLFFYKKYGLEKCSSG